MHTGLAMLHAAPATLTPCDRAYKPSGSIHFVRSIQKFVYCRSFINIFGKINGIMFHPHNIIWSCLNEVKYFVWLGFHEIV